MPPRLPLVLLALIVGLFPTADAAEVPDGPPLERRFEAVVRPFLKAHCLGCHGEKKQESKLDLSADTTAAAVARNQRTWDLVLERLEAEEMPPDDAPWQPTEGDREAVV